MRRLSQSKVNETIEMANNYQKHSPYRSKSTSHILPSLPINDAKKENTRFVRIRLVFIRIGEIDTLNEKYQADVYYEARWTHRINVVSSNFDDKQQYQLLHENSPIRLEELDLKIYWTPQLLIENAIGPINELDKWFTIKKSLESNSEALSPPVMDVNICEHRRLRGVFWEKLELNHFPADVQDLTISFTTQHRIEHCVLVPDEHIRSSINREAFSDQQEWKLYEHVATGLRQTQEEYSFQDENSVVEHKKHPVLAVTCRAARRPGYYYWNGFCLIFLITLCSFCIFSIPPDLPQSRLQITCTLLLTSVTFRWVVNRSLPTISYLTTLDKYAIISIIMLVILCLWHSIIAAIIFLNPETASMKSVTPTNIYVIVDRYMFISMFVIYIIIHIALIVWLIFVPYKRRREMEYLDREYEAKKYIQLEPTRVRYNSVQIQPQDMAVRDGSSNQGNLATARPSRPAKQSGGVMIMPNAGIFLPIREEANETAYGTIDFHEQDDVFYDHTHDINNEQKSTQIQPTKNA